MHRDRRGGIPAPSAFLWKPFASLSGMRARFSSACSFALASLAIGCGASGDKGGDGVSLDSGDGGGDGGFVFDGGSDADPGDGGLFGDVSGDVVSPPPGGGTSIYAHSADTLYKLDPKTLELSNVGAFGNTAGGTVTDMTDIALDKDGAMFGVSFNTLYKIDYKSGVHCTRLASLATEFNGLTFVPAGTIDPLKEVLVGVALDGGWYRVDVATGASSATVTKLGSYGSGYSSSGDSVGIIGDAVYSTVSTGFGGSDHVVTIDPKTGKVLKDIGDTGVGGFWGVGYWGGVMYGFSSAGDLYQIDLKTAKSTKVTIKGSPSGGFWGAGVTTSAPVVIK